MHDIFVSRCNEDYFKDCAKVSWNTSSIYAWPQRDCISYHQVKLPLVCAPSMWLRLSSGMGITTEGWWYAGIWGQSCFLEWPEVFCPRPDLPPAEKTTFVFGPTRADRDLTVACPTVRTSSCLELCITHTRNVQRVRTSIHENSGLQSTARTLRGTWHGPWRCGKKM
jgi:hypothetical protein